MKIIVIIFFFSNFLYPQEVYINYNIHYKKECLKINDSILKFKNDKIPYLKVTITNNSSQNVYIDINNKSIFFDYDSEYFDYSFLLHSLYDNKEPKIKYNFKKLNDSFVFEQDCNFDFFIYDLKNENKYKTESYELSENDGEFSLLNFMFKIQQKLDNLKTNKQIKLFNYKDKETIPYLEAFKMFRNNKNENIKNMRNRIYLKVNETFSFEKSLIIQKIYGGKYIFKYNFLNCEIKKELAFENEIYFYPNKITSNELNIEF